VESSHPATLRLSLVRERFKIARDNRALTRRAGFEKTGMRSSAHLRKERLNP
jgi:hypothetical protein